MFQKNRTLRKTPHSSSLEFVLAKHLQLEGAKTPWVLNEQRVDSIIDEYQINNGQLLDVLDKNQKMLMLNNPAWWDCEYYSEREMQKPGPVELDLAETEEIAVSALKALFDLDTKHRMLLKQSMKIEKSKSKYYKDLLLWLKSKLK